MLRDFLLASAHHLLVFGLIAMLATQSVLLSRQVDAATLRRLSTIDLALGMVAAALLLAGLLRVFLGVKGSAFYLHNPWFHAKLGAYLLAAGISIVPTIRFIRWRKSHKTDGAWLPAPADIAAVRRFVRIELSLVAVILVAAAGMARHGGLHL